MIDGAIAPTSPLYGEMVSRSYWLEIIIGSTIGGLVPELLGDGMLSYSALLLSTVGAFAGWWVGSRIRG